MLVGRRIGRGRGLLISGDSISYQLFITFLNFLRSELSETQYPFHGVGYEPVCVDVLGGGGFNLAWVCSPMLNATEVTQYVEEWGIDILLMNRGAWFRSDLSFVTELRQVVQVLQARYPHLLVFYRNTPPGTTIFFHSLLPPAISACTRIILSKVQALISDL